MLDEPSFPIPNHHDDDLPEIPNEVREIIQQLKLLYAIGGEAAVRTALEEAGLSDDLVAEMVENVKDAMEDVPPPNDHLPMQ